MPITPVLQRLREEDREFKGSFDYTESYHLHKQNKGWGQLVGCLHIMQKALDSTPLAPQNLGMVAEDYMSIILAHRRWRQEDPEFKVIFSYKTSSKPA